MFTEWNFIYKSNGVVDVEPSDIIINDNTLFNYDYTLNGTTYTVNFCYSDDNNNFGLKVGSNDIEITQWGGIPLTRDGEQFKNFPGSISVTLSTDLPTILPNTSLYRCFHDSNMSNDDFGNIQYWDVSNVTNIQGMFFGCNNFNQPLNEWDVSNVTTLLGTFHSCTNFNQPLNKWNVSNVTDMYRTFYECTNFNQELNNWERSTSGDISTLSNVTTMEETFSFLYKF